MTNRELEQRLKRAVDSTAPDHLEALLSRCEPKKGNVISMEHMMAKKRSGWARGLVAAVLALLLVGTGSGLTIGFMNYRQSYALASVVSLDINPSIELKVNRNEKVLACTGMNEDGTKVLSTMNGGKDLEGASLDLAVNALVGALLREGYMDVYSAMLISVEDNDQERAAQLRQRLVASVDGELQSAGAQVNVRSQSMSMNRQLSAQAQANNISSGKAYLVNQVRDLNSTLDFNELAQLSVEELDELIDAGAPGMPVGMAAAREAAKTYAGIQNNSTVTASVDAELDKNPARYDVSLFINDAEVVYRVDAYTGEVTSGMQNVSSFLQGENGQTKEPAGGDTPATDPETTTTQQPSSNQASGNTNAGQSGTTTTTRPNTTTNTNTNTSTNTNTNTNTNANTNTNTAATNDIGEAAAKAKAYAHAGVSASQVSNVYVKRDYDHGYIKYEIDFWVGSTKYDYDVAASNGSIVGWDVEYHNNTQQQPVQRPTQSNDIGQVAAQNAALSHAGLSASQVYGLKVEMDYEHGRIEYEVEFYYNGWEYDYTIDGTSGRILEYDRDWD